MKNAIFLKILPGAVLSILFLCAVVNSTAQTDAPPPPGDTGVASSTPEGTASGELPSNIAPGSALAEVVQMAQAGVDESIILSYIQNSGSPFSLTPDQIIYLKDLGLPSDAVTAMMQRDQQLGATQAAPTQPPPATTTAVTTEPPAVVTQNYFYDTLSPYGGWVNVEGYGLCWRPSAVVYDSGWQPYCQHGHWVYSDCGWYWLSDYSWGSCTFHYGRWFHNPRLGWCWWPDTTWGPSWVCWRYSNDYCGWAPLPPRCVFRPGVGIFFNGVVVSGGFDFGIGVNFFTFVPARNFCDAHPDRFRVHNRDAVNIFNHTTVINNFNTDNHHTVINNGIPHQRIAAVSATPIRQMRIRDTPTPGLHGERFERNRNEIIVNRQNISENVVGTLNRGVRPPAAPTAPHPASFNQNPPAPRGQQNHGAGAPGQNNFSHPQPAPGQNRHNPITPTPAPAPASEPPQIQRQVSPRQQPFENQNRNRNPNTFNQPGTRNNPSPPGQSAAPSQPNGFNTPPRQNAAPVVTPERPNVPEARHQTPAPPATYERPNVPPPRQEIVPTPAPRQQTVEPRSAGSNQSQPNPPQRGNDQKSDNGKNKDQNH